MIRSASRDVLTPRRHAFRPAGRLAAFLLLVVVAHTRPPAEAGQPNYTRGASDAVVFGVHEIAMTGSVRVANPFDLIVTVRFTPASGAKNSVVVDAFYDGDSTWRARVYVSEPGPWRWRSSCLLDPALDKRSGMFTAVPSALRGMLQRHPADPRQWITADGRWFLHISDTAYRLFHPHAAAFWREYVQDAVSHGVTSLRVAALGGWGGSPRTRRDDNNYWVYNDPWPLDPRADYSRFDLSKFQTTDARLIWLLDRYPDLYLQMILFGLRGYGTDDTGRFWRSLPRRVRQRTIRYMLARWSAFPNVYWLIVNDLHSDPGFSANRAFVREAGQFIAANDPWKHLLSTGPARAGGFPFTTDADLAWVSYAHIEDRNAVGAGRIKKYGLDRVPLHVFMAEDIYEQDHGLYDDPAFFFRWLIWSWTIAGGSANYGGRWGVIHPYSRTGDPALEWTGADGRVYTGRQLHGLDSIRHVRSFFEDRALDLIACLHDPSLASDLDWPNHEHGPTVAKCGDRRILAYHPNAIADGLTAKPHRTRTARLRVDLRRLSGSFAVEWYRPADGASRTGRPVRGGTVADLVAPWAGSDAVVLLSRVPSGR